MNIERLHELRRFANGLAIHAASKAFIECLDEIENLQEEVAENKQFFKALNFLRGGIAESVTFHQHNDDPPPCHRIDCNGEWTNWEDCGFEGETIQACLDMAVAEKEQAISDLKG